MNKSILDHELVPEHIILSESEVEKAFKNLDYEPSQLPKILVSDPVMQLIGAKEGDIIKIIRKSRAPGLNLKRSNEDIRDAHYVTYRIVVKNDDDEYE
ncbi:MAG: DNA-directed RNA polymerase subunit H [Methanobrevibacter sp.]|nr:DNA-directed RNA polymerase subunit H [Candidatus Methanoflexus mossambicus]